MMAFLFHDYYRSSPLPRGSNINSTTKEDVNIAGRNPHTLPLTFSGREGFNCIFLKDWEFIYGGMSRYIAVVLIYDNFLKEFTLFQNQESAMCPQFWAASLDIKLFYHKIFAAAMLLVRSPSARPTTIAE